MINIIRNIKLGICAKCLGNSRYYTGGFNKSFANVFRSLSHQNGTFLLEGFENRTVTDRFCVQHRVNIRKRRKRDIFRCFQNEAVGSRYIT